MQIFLLRFQILCVACLILSSMWVGAAYAQTGPQQDPWRPQQPQWPQTSPTTRSGSGGAERAERNGPPVIVYGDDDYKLAPRDVIEVIVEDAPELSVNYTINSKGVIPMRFLGPMSVAGQTTDMVARTITDGLRGRYLQDPQVYVSVKQYNSRTFFIQGAVRNPGVYVISGKPSLFRLLTIAGGLQENHGLVAYIFREKAPKPEKLETGPSQNGADSKINQFVKEAKGEAKVEAKVETKVENGVGAKGKDQGATQGGTNGGSQGRAVAKGEAKGTATATEGEPDYEMMTANIGGVFRGRLDNNIIVQPGDLVYIPPADVFYVAGEVKMPGQYLLRQGITLRQAISLAGGTGFKAKLGKGVIFRTDPITGNFTELPVDIGAVVSGKSQDMPILGNDVVWIPNSAAKSIGSTFLNTLIPLSVYRIP
ncbi:MAG: polysaccharide biosynthesis/export family protein [Blastocatellia bacterium]|nr:polysaccharide biosynthesis/export family protein [Blastocatellia bacterium]